MAAIADTPLGRLVAVGMQDEEYPGISIFLERGSRVLLLAVIEWDEGEMKLRAYPNAEDDEPSLRASFDELEHAFEMFGYEREGLENDG